MFKMVTIGASAKLIRLMNYVISFLYFCIILRIVLTSRRHSCISGDLVLIGVATLLALGHFFEKMWAIRFSAAISLLLLFLTLVYLLTPFDSAELPPFGSRLYCVFIGGGLSVLMVGNYYAVKSINGKG